MSDQQPAAAPQTEAPPALYAIVQLFGHQRIAGRISEQNFGGAKFIRVDVPEVSVPSGDGTERHTIAAHTRSFGAAAIYGIDWCDMTAAVLAAQQIMHEPISAWSAAQAIKALPEDKRMRLLGQNAAGVEDLDYPF